MVVLTISILGSGFFPRHRLCKVQVAFFSTQSFKSGCRRRAKRGGIMPAPRTTSRHSGLSPAILPSAHTTWREGEAGGKKMRKERERGRRKEGEKMRERIE